MLIQTSAPRGIKSAAETSVGAVFWSKEREVSVKVSAVHFGSPEVVSCLLMAEAECNKAGESHGMCRDVHRFGKQSILGLEKHDIGFRGLIGGGKHEKEQVGETQRVSGH